MPLVEGCKHAHFCCEGAHFNMLWGLTHFGASL